jgi:hypothetical protein
MKAVVFHGAGDVRLDDVPQPSAICGDPAAVTA